MITVLVCLMITIFGLIGFLIGMDEHAKRVELEEELMALRWGAAARRHPASRGRLPEWWEGSNEY